MVDPPTLWSDNDLAMRLHGMLEVDPRGLQWLDEWGILDDIERERAVKRVGIIRSVIAKHSSSKIKSRRASG